MSYRQLTVDEVRTLNSTLTARIYAVTSQARVGQTSAAFTAATQRLHEGLALADARINNYRQEGRGRRLSNAELIRTPPDGVPASLWTGGMGLLGVRTAAQQTYNAAMQGSLTSASSARSTAGAGARTPAATAALPQKQEPAAGETSAGGGPKRPARAGAGRTGGRRASDPEIDVEVDLPSPQEAVAAITRVGGEALDMARGTFSALRAVGALVTGAPSDLLGGGITTPLHVIDRLQAIATVLNPPSVAIYQRPWFWPTLLSIGGYLGYSYYKSTQQKKPAATAAKKKVIETAPPLPAAPGR